MLTHAHHTSHTHRLTSQADVVYDYEKGRNKGYGFVVFALYVQARAAVAFPPVLLGRPLWVKPVTWDNVMRFLGGMCLRAVWCCAAVSKFTKSCLYLQGSSAGPCTHADGLAKPLACLLALCFAEDQTAVLKWSPKG